MPLADHLPGVQQVSDLVRARTRDDLGEEVGVFTENTRPTAEAVERLIAAEGGLLALATGDLDSLQCPDVDAVREAFGQVVAKRVAAIIEASYRPDEVADGRTVADFYDGERDADREALATAATTCRAWTPDAGASGGGMSPVHTFRPLPPTGRW